MSGTRWVRDIRVYCPVAPATLAALPAGYTQPPYI